MKIDQATIDAVNAWLREHMHFTGTDAECIAGCLRIADLDAADVQSLILAMAECEPVRGLVEAAQSIKAIIQHSDGVYGCWVSERENTQSAWVKFYCIADFLVAIAPFAKGGA